MSCTTSGLEKSACSVDLNLKSNHKDSYTEIFMNESNNNNVRKDIDVVKLLELKSTDDDEQQSNSSSLESLDSLRNHQGSEDRETDAQDDSGSTSCSEDSFEMSSVCSIRQLNGLSKDSRETTCDSINEFNCEAPSNSSASDQFSRIKQSTSQSTSRGREKQNFEDIRNEVATQIRNLDTGLPNLDFEKLERELTCAAREREEHERKMLGEEVRRRLAQADYESSSSSSSSFGNAKKSNLALKLQPSKNLQVCYINEMSESENDNEFDDDSDDSDMELFVRRSKSAPNLKESLKSFNREANRIKFIIDKLKRNEELTAGERTSVIKHETQRVLLVAKNKADEALAEYRRKKSKASEIPRQARHYLSKEKIENIKEIRRLIESAIDKKNVELVQLLLERDNLHMENDSLNVDIDDYTQHESETSSLDLKHFMILQESIDNCEMIDTSRCQSSRTESVRDNSSDDKTLFTSPNTPTIPKPNFLPQSFSIYSFFKR